jgi:hypothetical protein
LIGCEKERESEKNIVRLLNRKSDASATPPTHRANERPGIATSASTRKRLEIALHQTLYLKIALREPTGIGPSNFLSAVRKFGSRVSFPFEDSIPAQVPARDGCAR